MPKVFNLLSPRTPWRLFFLDNVLGAGSCGAGSFMDGFLLPIVPLGYPIRQNSIPIRTDWYCRSLPPEVLRKTQERETTICSLSFFVTPTGLKPVTF